MKQNSVHMCLYFSCYRSQHMIFCLVSVEPKCAAHYTFTCPVSVKLKVPVHFACICPASVELKIPAHFTCICPISIEQNVPVRLHLPCLCRTNYPTALYYNFTFSAEEKTCEKCIRVCFLSLENRILHKSGGK